jgi:monoamine oxidase
MVEVQKEHRVVIVGAGFAGFNAAPEAVPPGWHHNRDRGDQFG